MSVLISAEGRFQFSSRERVKSQSFQLEFAAQGDNAVYDLDTGPMTFDAGEGIVLRPATIAIHNNGDMPGHMIGIYFFL